MRTLPGGMPVDDLITRPVYLLSLTFPSATVRYISRATATISGTVWTAADFAVSQITNDARGGQRCEVDLASHDGAVRTLILSEAFRGGAADVWMVYGAGPWVNGDRVLVFSGAMDSAPTIGDRVRLVLTSAGFRTEFSPRHRAGPPFNNHIPAPGEKVTWNATTTTIPGGG